MLTVCGYNGTTDCNGVFSFQGHTWSLHVQVLTFYFTKAERTKTFLTLMGRT